MTADTLMLDDGVDTLRLRIDKDASGKVTGLTSTASARRTKKGRGARLDAPLRDSPSYRRETR
jgi:hypothetical protein